jgi:hypothetical protein
MQTEISPYDATGDRDALTRLALQRANIMDLVDLKRGEHSPRRTEMRIDRLTDRPQSISILSKSAPHRLTCPRRVLPSKPDKPLPACGPCSKRTLPTIYGVSRDIARKARAAVLSSERISYRSYYRLPQSVAPACGVRRECSLPLRQCRGGQRQGPTGPRNLHDCVRRTAPRVHHRQRATGTRYSAEGFARCGKGKSTLS